MRTSTVLLGDWICVDVDEASADCGDNAFAKAVVAVHIAPKKRFSSLLPLQATNNHWYIRRVIHIMMWARKAIYPRAFS